MHTFFLIERSQSNTLQPYAEGGHGQRKSDKRTNNDLRNTTEKTED